MHKNKRLIVAVVGIEFLMGLLASQFVVAIQEAPKAKPAVATINHESVTRDEILATAREYAEHKWSANSKHVFHGKDEKGNQVDTPDKSYRDSGFIVGQENVGVPYKWGGFSSIEEFDKGIAADLFAGHLPKKGSSRSSPQAVGVDCSGLVSRCWDLPRKHSTRSLGNLCYFLDSYDELKPGDIINSFDGHAVIFDSFADTEKTKVVVYEAGGTRVKKSVYPVSRLKKGNFKPLRYKPLDDRWVRQTLAPANFKAADIDQGRFIPDGEETNSLDGINNPLSAVKLGDWVSYGMDADEQTRFSVSNVDSDKIVIRSRYLRGGKAQLNERTSSVKDTLLESIIDFAGFDQDFGEIELKNEKVEFGQFQVDENSFKAYRLLLEIQTSLLIRGTTYSVTLKVDCLISDEVPLAGIIKSRYELKLLDQGEVRRRSVKQMKLTEFFKG